MFRLEVKKAHISGTLHLGHMGRARGLLVAQVGQRNTHKRDGKEKSKLCDTPMRSKVKRKGGHERKKIVSSSGRREKSESQGISIRDSNIQNRNRVILNMLEHKTTKEIDNLIPASTQSRQAITQEYFRDCIHRKEV
ncbi:hypothetical protein Ancab_004821 [Ancistrocladus abbreviatus]